MHDGRTRNVEALTPDRREPFLEVHRASITILRGPAAGMEYRLEEKRTTLGRSAQVKIQIDDPSISSEHVAFELGSDGFGIRDLASTNGVRLNGSDILASPLKHGDRISLGECELQYVVEDRVQDTKTWVLDSEDTTKEEP